MKLTRAITTLLATATAVITALTLAPAAPTAAAPSSAPHQVGTSRAVQFLAPQGDHLQGTVDLQVSAPKDTTRVRFYLDDVQLSEVTSIYADQTKTPADWRTATDVGWFPPGGHTLRAEAYTSSGPVSAVRRVITTTAPALTGVTPLNGAWQFTPASALPAGAAEGDRPPAVQPAFASGSWPTIVVPDSFGAVRAEWNDDAGLLGVYRRELSLDAPDAGDRTALVFESCFWACRYFVNGLEVGSSEGGYLPTRLDVTDAVRPGRNTVAVVVDNRTSTMGGYARPVQGLYWNFGGLLQEARLERTPPVALVETRAEGTASGQLTLRPTGVNATGVNRPVDAMVTVEGPGGERVLGPTRVQTTVPAEGGAATPIRLTVAHPSLWDLEHPNLYTVHLRALGDAAWRALVEQTGFRDVRVDGLDVLLNGNPVEDLPGFNRHADYPGLGRTQPSGLADREIKALHDKGFRLFRPAHYPTTPAELHAADRYGLLVIEEVNNISSQPGSFLAESEVQEFGKQTLSRMVARDRSHPSIFAWSVGNENATETDGGVDYVKNVIGHGRSIDPTRLYTQVSHRHTRDRAYPYQDFFATNYYAGWYSTMESLESHLDAVQQMAKMPVLLSEYGAEAVTQRSGLGRGTEYYQAQIVDEHNRLLNKRPHFIGKMYWTSTEFWCTPTWGSGQNPEPVPPFHTKGLQTYFRDGKLGWRVMFSPARIRQVTVLEAPLDQPVTRQEKVTIDDARGVGAQGVVKIDLPDGFTAPEVPFSVTAGGSTTVIVPVSGTLKRDAVGERVLVRAVIDDDTEALPVATSIRSEDEVRSPASDDFSATELDPAWQVVRPDPSGWSLTDRAGWLRLSTLPGGETGSSNTGSNVVVRSTTPQTDFTAEATVEAADLTADFQQVGLLAYTDDDNNAKVDLGWIDGRRAIEFVVESGARVESRASVPYNEVSAHLRLVRRGTTVTADYSTDGRDWYAVGSGEVAGAPRAALQAVGGGAAPPVVPTFVDGVDVRTSGDVTAETVSVPEQPLVIGQPGQAGVVVANGSDHAVDVTAGLTVPTGWTADRRDSTVPAFGSVTIPLAVMATGPPSTGTLTASVTSATTTIWGAPATEVLTAPAREDTLLALDAGTPTSSVFNGWDRLSQGALWSDGATFGWVGSPPQSRDRGGLDALRRDIVTNNQPGTLRLRVPPGRHAVDFLIGDGSFPADAMTIRDGDQTLLTVDPPLPAGTFRWHRFQLDGGAAGRLVDLTFDAEKPGQFWRFAAMVVEKDQG